MRRILLDEPVTPPVTRMTNISSTDEVRTLRARMAEGIVPVTEATMILRALLDAMRGGLADGGRLRTITPDAVVLEEDGRASIVDGNAGVTRGRSATEDAYRAPEASGWEGGTDHESAERSVVYSWGVVAYELLVGVVPFATADSPEALRLAHATESPVPIAPRTSGLPAPLAAVVMACLAKDPRDRPTVAMLRDALDEAGVAAVPSSSRLRWRARRIPTLALLVLVVVAVLLLVGARSLRVLRV